MTVFARNDTSPLGRWWWTVDRWTVTALSLLIAIGVLLVLAATPSVAERLTLDPYHLAWRHIAYVALAIAVLLGVSLLSPASTRWLALAVCALAVAGIVVTLFLGAETKGARRWIDLGALSVQPSEFVKPSCAIVVAWLLARHRETGRAELGAAATGLVVLVLGLLFLQPDIGMASVILAAWYVQLLIAGLSLPWVVALTAGACGLAIAAYLLLPHVASRIDRFLDPGSGDNFQVETSLQAFMNGGVFGRGPGQGTIKGVLPDAHADFIFAVAGEEFGLVACLLILALFAFVVLRGLGHALGETNLFVMVGVAGLAVQFGLQAVVHMGSSLRLLPAKGMTLPFISYGGSSLVAVALAMGLLLALTRRRIGDERS
ncbi:MAG: putative peptidoglycan glycosyltransferase FtsW [Defluviicoccus sp.]|nr:putative peptidoglycan glycosyltransferase FtsW [Defluviicoccus sp.]MDE0385390.1 putative peptidoglycan glycosyltransferase FtsW [Defluviicoccus sp.]